MILRRGATNQGRNARVQAGALTVAQNGRGSGSSNSSHRFGGWRRRRLEANATDGVLRSLDGGRTMLFMTQQLETSTPQLHELACKVNETVDVVVFLILICLLIIISSISVDGDDYAITMSEVQAHLAFILRLVGRSNVQDVLVALIDDLFNETNRVWMQRIALTSHHAVQWLQ